VGGKGREVRKGTGRGEYGQSTSYSCVKMYNETHYRAESGVQW
jgi:hypothetical protein